MRCGLVRAVGLLAVGLAVLPAACQGGKKYYPVRGQVTVDGKPGEGVLVVLHPLDAAEGEVDRPSATVQADGSFVIQTYVVKDRVTRDGAPAGRYAVTCVWYPPDVQKYLSAAAPLPDRLNGKYSDPKSPAQTIEVPEGPLDIPPIQLTSKK